jgi:hypothetical protein
MPFTPSHAIVALPFVRTRLIPAAIAIGAMTPDLPLFVRRTPVTYLGTHDPWWLPATALLAFVLLLVWRCLLRPAARELAPHALAARLPSAWDAGFRAALGETVPRRWGSALLLLASLAIGVASHIVWDAFTHGGRFGLVLVPALVQPWGPLRGFTWMQHASSVVGIMVLVIAGAVWWRRQRTAPVTRVLPPVVRVAWWLSLPVGLGVAWTWGLVAFGPLHPEFTVAQLAYRVLPPACAVWAAVTLVLCLIVQAQRRRMVRNPV